jgi:hypothetical protein
MKMSKLLAFARKRANVIPANLRQISPAQSSLTLHAVIPITVGYLDTPLTNLPAI